MPRSKTSTKSCKGLLRFCSTNKIRRPPPSAPLNFKTCRGGTLIRHHTPEVNSVDAVPLVITCSQLPTPAAHFPPRRKRHQRKTGTSELLNTVSGEATDPAQLALPRNPKSKQSNTVHPRYPQLPCARNAAYESPFSPAAILQGQGATLFC